MRERPASLQIQIAGREGCAGREAELGGPPPPRRHPPNRPGPVRVGRIAYTSTMRYSGILILLVILRVSAQACTAFCIADRGVVLVGNNEDYNNPKTRIWFVPGQSGKAGAVFVGFDNLFPQGGMNEHGLWFDGFATAPVDVTRAADKPPMPPNFVPKVMSECATVEQVVRSGTQFRSSTRRLVDARGSRRGLSAWPLWR